MMLGTRDAKGGMFHAATLVHQETSCDIEIIKLRGGLVSRGFISSGTAARVRRYGLNEWCEQQCFHRPHVSRNVQEL